MKNRETAEAILQQMKNLYIKLSENPEVQSLSARNDAESSRTKPELTSARFVEEIDLLSVPIEPDLIMTDKELISRLKGTDLKPVKYMVQEGDCVSCIAHKFNVPQDVIYANNSWIENDFIAIGDELDLTVRKPKLSVKTEEHYSEIVSVPSGKQVTCDDTMRVGI